MHKIYTYRMPKSSFAFQKFLQNDKLPHRSGVCTMRLGIVSGCLQQKKASVQISYKNPDHLPDLRNKNPVLRLDFFVIEFWNVNGLRRLSNVFYILPQKAQHFDAFYAVTKLLCLNLFNFYMFLKPQVTYEVP